MKESAGLGGSVFSPYSRLAREFALRIMRASWHM